MSTKLLTLLAFSLIVFSCKKDTFTTRPGLKFKSVNGNTFGLDQVIFFELEFTDKEGDIQDTLFIEKVSLVPSCVGFIDKQRIPDFTPTANLKGALEIGYATSSNSGSNYPIIPKCNKDDTCYFRFWLKDKGNNVSDTVKSGNIVILK